MRFAMRFAEDLIIILSGVGLAGILRLLILLLGLRGLILLLGLLVLLLGLRGLVLLLGLLVLLLRLLVLLLRLRLRLLILLLRLLVLLLRRNVRLTLTRSGIREFELVGFLAADLNEEESEDHCAAGQRKHKQHIEEIEYDRETHAGKILLAYKGNNHSQKNDSAGNEPKREKQVVVNKAEPGENTCGAYAEGNK